MTLQTLIDQLQALAHEGHAQDEVVLGIGHAKNGGYKLMHNIHAAVYECDGVTIVDEPYDKPLKGVV